MWQENVACVPKFFDFREVVYLCAKNFDLKPRTIKLGIKKSLISITPKVFKKIVNFIDPMR